MAKISLEVPDQIHRWLKRKQLDRQEAGRKVTMKELYNELIRQGFEQGIAPVGQAAIHSMTDPENT